MILFACINSVYANSTKYITNGTHSLKGTQLAYVVDWS